MESPTRDIVSPDPDAGQGPPSPRRMVTEPAPNQRLERRVSLLLEPGLINERGEQGLNIELTRRNSTCSSRRSSIAEGGSPRELLRKGRRMSSTLKWSKQRTQELNLPPSPQGAAPNNLGPKDGALPSARHAGMLEGIILTKENYDDAKDRDWDEVMFGKEEAAPRFIDGLPTRKELLRAMKDQSQLHEMASLGRPKDVEVLVQGGAERDHDDAFGKTPVHVAAKYGHAAVVQALARLGAKLEQGDHEGQTPLHIALQSGQAEVISTLLSLQADVHSTSSGGLTTLHHAVCGLQPEACAKLIAMKADGEALTDKQESPVRMAVRLGCASALDSLLVNRCEVQTRDEDGASPLHLAACKHRLEIMDVLIHRGARIEAYDSFGMTPLHWAARSGEHEAAAKLVELKANVTCRTTQDRHTSVHLAVMADELETLRVLIAARASLNAQDKRGFSPLHTAVEHNRLEAMSCLLEHGAEKDLQTVLDDTALHLSCRRSRAQLTRMLTAAGSSVNFRGRNGFTGLHIAADVGSVACATVLLEHASAGKEEAVEAARRQSANMRDYQSQLPLHLAACHGRLELCQILLMARSEVDAFDGEKLTPLSFAVARDHDQVVRCLLQYQANPVRRNEQELTPLQQACVAGAITVAKTLTEMRLLPDREEPEWRRPLALAKFYGHEDLADFFSKPCPKARLALRGRAVNGTTIAVTFSAIFAEPPVTAVLAQCVLSPEVEEEVERVEPGAETGEKPDPFSKEDVDIKQVTVYQDEWADGKTINIDGLEAEMPYLVRLVAENDAGTTYGDHITLRPTAAAGKSRRLMSRQNTNLASTIG